MKKILLFFLLVHTSIALQGQFPVSVDSVYTFIKYNSVMRKTVDWEGIDRVFSERMQSAKSLKDTMGCFVSVLESLNDVHSQIFLNNQYYGNYPRFEDTTLAWLKPINDKSVSLTNQISTAILEKEIGYIRVPSVQVYGEAPINAFAQALRDSIQQLSSNRVKGYILDLRLNGGGNIYPMLTGLSPFLGDQLLGYETDVDSSLVRKWKITDGNFFIGDYQSTNIPNSPETKLEKIPVAVLIGPVTKSSGSMTAIAFKQRPKTVFIGEPTAEGYTTSNGYFQFAPNLTLNFATYFVADRNGTVYPSAVNPDLFIYHGDQFDALNQDEKIKSAILWLKKMSDE